MQQEEGNFYDEAILYDLVENLKNEGWVIRKNEDKEPKVFKVHKGRFMGTQITGLLGSKGKGKTYLLKQLLEENNLAEKKQEDGIFLKKFKIVDENQQQIAIEKVFLDYRIPSAFLSSTVKKISPEKSFYNQETLRIITENFIIKNSSIIILVVSKDSLEDYKVLNKIKKIGENLRIIVIHNYHQYKDGQFISDEIEGKFENQKNPNKEAQPHKIYFKGKNGPYFFLEKYRSSTNKENAIAHLFYCDISKLKEEDRQNWEEVNENTLKYVKQCILNCRMYQKKFNLIDNFVKYMNEVNKTNNPGDQPQVTNPYWFVKKFDMKEEEAKEIRKKNAITRTGRIKQIFEYQNEEEKKEEENKDKEEEEFFSKEILEEICFDIQPGYRTLYSKGEKKLVVEIEIPGTLESFEAKLLFDLDSYCLKIFGKKKEEYKNEDGEKIQARTNIDSGRFFSNIFLPYANGLIKSTIPKGNFIDDNGEVKKDYKGFLEKVKQKNKADNSETGNGIYKLKLDLFYCIPS